MYSVANRLARQGRGGDDTLVHMNRGEVAGLNAINHLVNNRPLSTNPTTGLPEAMDLTDILIGLGIGAAAIFTGGAAAAAAPAAWGSMGALAAGAGAGAATGAALNTGKAAIKGDQDLGQAAAFGGLSGLLSGAGGAMGVGEAAGGFDAGNVAAQNISTTAKDVITPGLDTALTDSATKGLGSLAETPTPTNLLGDASKFISPNMSNAATPPIPEGAGFSGLPADLAKSDQLAANAAKITGAPSASFANPNPNLANPDISMGEAANRSFSNLQNTVMNPGQHQTLLAAQLGAAGLEDQYKQQGLNEQANAKQAANIVKQYRDAGIMPSELPKQLTDMAGKFKGMAAGGTVRDVEGLRSIPTGFVNQQPMTNFYPQSMIPQAQPLQSTQPIRHEVIGYADGGAVGYGYAEGGDIGGGDEGLLHGPGTGQSDGIMGLIDGEQGQELVRLAESEFVIPADVVSALGDGSTKAGAKALYDMINRIRMQAHGHIKQSNPVNPAEVLPA